MTAEQIGLFIKNCQHKIVVTKLEHGYLVDSNGKVHSGTTARGAPRVVSRRTSWTADGIAMEVVQGKDFTLPNGTTTQGISQYAYFAGHDLRVKTLGFLKRTVGEVGTLFDLMDLAEFVRHSNSGAVLPLGALASLSGLSGVGMLFDLLGAIARYHFLETERVLNEVRARQLHEAKGKGLDAVESLVTSWKNWNGDTLEDHEIEYGLMGISQEVALQIIQGKYEQFKEIPKTDVADVQILYRMQFDSVRKHFVYIVETFFVGQQDYEESSFSRPSFGAAPRHFSAVQMKGAESIPW